MTTKRENASALAKAHPKKKAAPPDRLARPMYLLTKRNFRSSTKADKEEMRALAKIVEEGLDYVDLEIQGALALKTVWEAYTDGVQRGRGNNSQRVYLDPNAFPKAMASLLDTLRRVKDSRRLAEQGSGPANIALMLGDPTELLYWMLDKLVELGHAEAAEAGRGLVVDVTPKVADEHGRGDRLEVA